MKKKFQVEVVEDHRPVVMLLLGVCDPFSPARCVCCQNVLTPASSRIPAAKWLDLPNCFLYFYIIGEVLFFRNTNFCFISQSVKFIGHNFPFSVVFEKQKSSVTRSPQSLFIYILLPLCSLGCLIWMEMGSWACQRWQGNMLFFLVSVLWINVKTHCLLVFVPASLDLNNWKNFCVQY